MRLARRPASHPPDQRQDSAVTYVAPCVVSAIAIIKRFFLCAATMSTDLGCAARCRIVTQSVTNGMTTRSVTR
ncbi:hypothetical protein ALP18_100822 [Pseudomonas amygdali pv. myricae]|nr:hypothetical protein ALP46_100916 [Pseudomonas amygdali pv. myricae]RMV04803.1 hypothetical protein ALP18_100822 [Pseudomonas amygdali pv. myricae]